MKTLDLQTGEYYLLRGYDAYDMEYYPIGEYATYAEAKTAYDQHKLQQQAEQNNDFVEIKRMVR